MPLYTIDKVLHNAYEALDEEQQGVVAAAVQRLREANDSTGAAFDHLKPGERAGMKAAMAGRADVIDRLRWVVGEELVVPLGVVPKPWRLYSAITDLFAELPSEVAFAFVEAASRTLPRGPHYRSALAGVQDCYRHAREIELRPLGEE